MVVLALPNHEFPPGEDALRQADRVLDSLDELTAETVGDFREPFAPAERSRPDHAPAPPLVTREATTGQPGAPPRVRKEAHMHVPLRALLCALPLLAYAASSTTPAYAYDDAGYLAYADRMTERLDGTWNEERGLQARARGRRRDGQRGAAARPRVAAQRGHHGPARNDQRARRSSALVTAPAFFDRRPAHRRRTADHVPGW